MGRTLEGVGKPEISISDNEANKVIGMVEKEFSIKSTNLNYDKIEIYCELEGNMEDKCNEI